MKKLFVLCLTLILAQAVNSIAYGEVEDPALKGKTVAGIILLDDQFFRIVNFGMKARAEKAGVKYMNSNSKNLPDKEISLIDTYVARGVNAITISPISKQGSAQALKTARDKGIAVVTYNSTVDGDAPQSFVQSDQFNVGVQTGKAAREYIEKNLGGKAEIAILAFKSNIPEQSDARTGGFKSEVTKLPGVKIIAEQDAWMPETAIKKAGDIITANPGVNMIYGANEGATVGSVMAVKNAGKAGSMTVFGTDVSEQLLGFLLSKDNILQAVTAQKPYDIGYTAMDNAIKLLEGKPVEKLVSMPGVLLTRANPQEVEDYLKTFKEMIK